jgi:hypothetical protein
LQRSLGDQRVDLFGVPQNIIFPGSYFYTGRDGNWFIDDNHWASAAGIACPDS